MKEFDWRSNNMRHQYLTCRNHRGMRYLTKHPALRTLHVVEVAPEVLAAGYLECSCPYEDLVVLVAEVDSDTA